VSVNSFLNSATKIRNVHRGLAEACNPLLPMISVEMVDLVAEDDDDWLS
jgi:hypothetical protein